MILTGPLGTKVIFLAEHTQNKSRRMCVVQASFP